MILHVDHTGRVWLSDADDLKAFKITGTRPDAHTRPRVVDAGLSLTDDDGHAFVTADQVRHWAVEAGPLPAEWHHEFDAMVAYATSKGWTDEHGRLRAHTEWQA